MSQMSSTKYSAGCCLGTLTPLKAIELFWWENSVMDPKRQMMRLHYVHVIRECQDLISLLK